MRDCEEDMTKHCANFLPKKKRLSKQQKVILHGENEKNKNNICKLCVDFANVVSECDVNVYIQSLSESEKVNFFE